MSEPPTRSIRFFHRGTLVKVDGVAATTTVLDWLRESARCTGTKEACNEGDCGACTVVVGRRVPVDASVDERVLEPVAEPGHRDAVDSLELRAVNACTMFLPTLDGKALFTVEDVAAADGALHPVQQALVDCHASQCGFCTPGFVMSLWAAYEQHQGHRTRPSRRELADLLAGNLCRCTGYRPIVDAGVRMFELPPQRLETKPVLDALATIASNDTFAYAVHATQGAQPPGARQPDFYAPRSVDALAELVDRHRDARLLAGSTDIGLWVTKQHRVLPTLIHPGEVDELRRVDTRADGTLVIGAAVSLEAAWRALARRHATLREVGLRFASPPVRHAGTMAGNIANGSPIGDGAPVLMALDAVLVLRRATNTRRLPLADFYVDYMKSRLEPGEFIQAIEVPPPAGGLEVRSDKISKRHDSDISALCTGFALALDDASGEATVRHVRHVRHVRLAFGGMAATVKRAAHAEAAMLGQPWTEATLRAAQAALDHDFTPITDLRASRDYRMTVARNLIERLWLETRAVDPLPMRATRVWAVTADKADGHDGAAP